MDPAVWIALIGLFIAGGLTPGPAVMLVMSSALRHGWAPAMLPAFGVTLANLGWVALAASGAAALAVTFPAGFMALKLAGLAFILWLAIGLVRHDPVRPAAASTYAPSRTGLFLRGVGLQFANPNALVYFGVLLPAFFDPARPIGQQVAIVMVSVTATELMGLTLYARLADALNRRFQSAAFARRFNWFAAGLMAVSAGFAVFSTAG